MCKKCISIFLIFAITFTFSPCAFASSYEADDAVADYSIETMYIKGENGTIYEVQVEEYSYSSAGSKISLYSSGPQVGDTKTVVVRISNGQLMAPLTIGQLLSSTALK